MIDHIPPGSEAWPAEVGAADYGDPAFHDGYSDWTSPPGGPNVPATQDRPRLAVMSGDRTARGGDGTMSLYSNRTALIDTENAFKIGPYIAGIEKAGH
jgi:hypothetical protein